MTFNDIDLFTLYMYFIYDSKKYTKNKTTVIIVVLSI